MASEQNFRESMVHFGLDEAVPHKQKQNSASDNTNGCFDCNICLDSAHDPVVTLCGHLYCWPCIYKWLRVRSPSVESSVQPKKCPVCKSDISHSSLVPLYGRGMSPSDSNSRWPHLDPIVPRRPPALNVHPTSLNPFQSQPPQFYHHQYLTQPYGNSMAGMLSPTVGMLGEMVFARMFAGSDTGLFAYGDQSTYHHPLLTGGGTPRMRRLEMQVDKSLNRVSVFLFCCFVLCLLLF